jgi:hypothetical protein
MAILDGIKSLARKTKRRRGMREKVELRPCSETKEHWGRGIQKDFLLNVRRE